MNQILIKPKIYTQTFQWWEQKLVKACTGEKYWWWGWWWWWHGKVVVNFLTEYETIYRLVNTYVSINFSLSHIFYSQLMNLAVKVMAMKKMTAMMTAMMMLMVMIMMRRRYYPHGALMSDSDQNENITLNLYWNLCFRCFPLRRNPKSWTKRRPETS